MDAVSSIFKEMVRSYFRSLLDLVKIRAAVGYVNGVKVTRQLFMLWCALVFCLVLLAIGLALIPIALCLFMPWSAETKAIVAISFALVYIIVPLILLLTIFSQKRWMRISKANELVNSILEKKL